MKVVSSDVTDSSEIGKMTFGVACSDTGGVDDVITLVGGTNTATSITTVAGELKIVGDTGSTISKPKSVANLLRQFVVNFLNIFNSN